jgi:hypothetical protein
MEDEKFRPAKFSCDMEILGKLTKTIDNAEFLI